MSTFLNRRRFLTLMGSASLLPMAAHAEQARWHGTALGAPATMVLAGLSRQDAEPIFASVEAELDRLESIFSLYRPASQISRLNETGSLDAPALELLEVLGLAGTIYAATDGRFDPTIQPLWLASARASAEGRALNPDKISALGSLVGWSGLQVTPARIAFNRPGMGLTLNGIAQGYITDRIQALLHRHGLKNTLVDMGEIVGSGRKSNGDDWIAGIAAPDGQIVRRVTVSDRALATSAPVAPLVDGSVAPHIFDPETGAVGATRLISVSAGTGALADGLSTGLSLLPRDRVAAALQQFRGAKVEYLG